MKEFSASKNGPLHEQAWLKDDLKMFVDNIYKIDQFFCSNCHELWPSLTKRCIQCLKDPILLSSVIQFKFFLNLQNAFILKDNEMIPFIDKLPKDIQKYFEELTMVEEILISPILAVMSIYRLPNGTLKQRGFMANFTQDISEITQV